MNLAGEGNNGFTLRVINLVGTAATFSQTVTRDTTGPVFSLAAQTHQGELGNQYYDDVSLAVYTTVPAAVTWTTFVFKTEYKDAANFKYTGTLFDISAADAFGGVASQTKTLYKLVNGAWQLVTPFNPSLPYLGQDVFGNNLYQSAAYVTSPTVWRIHLQGIDDLGNTSAKDYAFRVFIAPPALVVSNFHNGATSCFSGITAAYFMYYASSCTPHRDPQALLSATNTNWVNNNVSLISVDLKNPTDQTIYFNPVSFATDYNIGAQFRNNFRMNKLEYSDLVDSTTVWNECYNSGNALSDNRQSWNYTTNAWNTRAATCTNYNADLTGDYLSAGVLYSRSIYTIVTTTGNVVLPATSGNEYAIAPGTSVRVWIQVQGPIGNYILSQKTWCIHHDGVSPYNPLWEYLGYRDYLYWMYHIGGTTTDYDRYISCDEWESLYFGWAPTRAGSDYRYGARMPWETGEYSRTAGGASLPNTAVTIDLSYIW